MNHSRRAFLSKGGQIAATGMVGALIPGCARSAEESAQQPPAPSLEPAPSQETPEPGTPDETPKAMVAACGLSCMACPLMKAGTCKGCASGKEATPEMLEMKPCPVLQCAAKKQIDYCGTGCEKFAECEKLIGHPYAQSFMDMMKKRMGSSA